MKLLDEVFKIDKKLLYYLPFLLDKVAESQIQNWKSFKQRNHFVFIGNFYHKPNVDAIVNLKKNIWSTIRTQLPKAEIHVYGAYMNQQIQEFHHKKDGFIIKGFAENAQEVVKNAKVVLAPLRFGAGIKGKLTEAMLCGTPSVTTSIGAEGMHNHLPWNGCIEDDPSAFAEKANQLYTDEKLWEISQNNGIEIINQIYNKEKVSEPFIKKILSIQQHLETHRTQNFLGSLLQHQTMKATKYMSKWIEAKSK
jgi:glycosyltransferase involved in cell wall biosynthesis